MSLLLSARISEYVVEACLGLWPGWAETTMDKSTAAIPKVRNCILFQYLRQEICRTSSYVGYLALSKELC